VYVDNDQIVLAHARALLAGSVPVAARTHAEVCGFFTGLDLVEPGVVQVHRWRPEAADVDSDRDLTI
jgi:hypothetical protein